VTGTIVQLSISAGGVPKHAIAFADVTRLGLAGDVQKHRRIHGGPDRALCLFALEVIDRLRAEGHPIAPGTTGENITIRGLDWPSIYPGDRLALGAAVVLEITELTDPCKQIRASFQNHFFRRILAHGDSRLYARVLSEGFLRVGDPVTVLR
jgi:MOSC domain-containing protein YiiM